MNYKENKTCSTIIMSQRVMVYRHLKDKKNTITKSYEIQLLELKFTSLFN